MIKSEWLASSQPFSLTSLSNPPNHSYFDVTQLLFRFLPCFLKIESEILAFKENGNDTLKIVYFIDLSIISSFSESKASRLLFILSCPLDLEGWLTRGVVVYEYTVQATEHSPYTGLQ